MRTNYLFGFFLLLAQLVCCSEKEKRYPQSIVNGNKQSDDEQKRSENRLQELYKILADSIGHTLTELHEASLEVCSIYNQTEERYKRIEKGGYFVRGDMKGCSQINPNSVIVPAFTHTIDKVIDGFWGRAHFLLNDKVGKRKNGSFLPGCAEIEGWKLFRVDHHNLEAIKLST